MQLLFAQSAHRDHESLTRLYVVSLYDQSVRPLKMAPSQVGVSGDVTALNRHLYDLLDVIPHDVLEETVLLNVPKGTEELNTRAIRAGRDLYLKSVEQE